MPEYMPNWSTSLSVDFINFMRNRFFWSHCISNYMISPVSIQSFVVYDFHLYRLFFIYDVLRIVFFLYKKHCI